MILALDQTDYIQLRTIVSSMRPIGAENSIVGRPQFVQLDIKTFEIKSCGCSTNW